MIMMEHRVTAARGWKGIAAGARFGVVVGSVAGGMCVRRLRGGFIGADRYNIVGFRLARDL